MFHLNISPIFPNEPLEEEKIIDFELKAKSKRTTCLDLENQYMAPSRLLEVGKNNRYLSYQVRLHKICTKTRSPYKENKQ